MSTTETHHDATGDSTGEAPTNGRRALFAKGAAAAAAATVAGLAIGRTASAGDGDNLIIGQSNLGNLTTSLSGGTTFRVISGGSATATSAGKLSSIYGRQTNSGDVGVLGEFSGTGGGWGVHGYNNSSSGRGVCGINVGEGGIGVYGEHDDTSTSGTGVMGVSKFGSGVIGSGTSTDFSATGSGRVRLQAVGTTGTTTNSGLVGNIARDANGNLWYAYAGNSWRKVAGAGTAGAFHAITPARVYDSRWSDGRIQANENRTVGVANGRDLSTGVVNAANLVPAGATAIVGNLTIAGTLAGAGALAVTPGGTGTFSASSINWSGAGVLLANGFTVGVDGSRNVKVYCLGTGTNFIIDVVGYYL